VVGALLVGALTSALRDTFRFWEIGIASLFIAVVLAYPQGLMGLVAPLVRRYARPPRSEAGIDAPMRVPGNGAARLVVQDVEVRLGEVLVLDRLSLAIERPGIFCVIGPNGAGKTST